MTLRLQPLINIKLLLMNICKDHKWKILVIHNIGIIKLYLLVGRPLTFTRTQPDLNKYYILNTRTQPDLNKYYILNIRTQPDLNK